MDYSKGFSDEDLYRNERNGIIAVVCFVFCFGVYLGQLAYGVSTGPLFLFSGFSQFVGALILCSLVIWGGGFLFFSLKGQWEDPGSEEAMWKGITAALCFSPVIGFFGFPFSQDAHVMDTSLHLFLRDTFFLLTGLSIGVAAVGVIHDSYKHLALE